jgi:hypothetical protein
VRIVEGDGGGARVRERQLGRGESVTLQPGDRLAVGAGARLRFEPGKRVPGSVPSGVGWADPGARRGTGGALALAGVSITMLGAALALIAPGRGLRAREAVGVPLGLVAFALAAAAWGVYAIYAAPDLLVGATLLTPLLELPATAMSASHVLGIALAVALVMLFAGVASALAGRVVAIVEPLAAAPATRGRLARGAWILVCAAALGAAPWLADPWPALLAGLGLLASAWAAPALAARDARAWLTGAVAGTVVFGALALTGGGGVPLLSAPPALLAGPVAWAAARLVGARGGSRSRAVAA